MANEVQVAFIDEAKNIRQETINQVIALLENKIKKPDARILLVGGQNAGKTAAMAQTMVVRIIDEFVQELKDLTQKGRPDETPAQSHKH